MILTNFELQTLKKKIVTTLNFLITTKYWSL